MVANVIIWTDEEFIPIKQGLELYNHEEYWECHEILEDVWKEEQRLLQRNAVWAIIQVAASLYHVQRSNLEGAYLLIVKAKEKIQRVEKYIQENQIQENCLDFWMNWSSFVGLVHLVPQHPQLTDFQALHEFIFVDGQK